jgi:Protein of unknown function (DUF1488)
MPLTRDRIIGHDNERLAFRFTMLNNEVTVECQISDAAMDELAGVKGTESIARQAQFLALRDAVESIASVIFDKGPVVKGQVVRIFTKHVRTDPRLNETTAGPPGARPLQIITETSLHRS